MGTLYHVKICNPTIQFVSQKENERVNIQLPYLYLRSRFPERFKDEYNYDIDHIDDVDILKRKMNKAKSEWVKFEKEQKR